MTNTTKTMTALLIGAAAGAVLGVLFAPDRGDKTRDKLKKFARTTSDDLKSYVDKGTAYAKSKIEAGKEQVARFASDVQGKASEMTAQAEDVTGRMKTDIRETRSGIKPNTY
jgi:gas vesicle protein